MSDEEIKNATIEGVTLGFNDHGWFTFYITVSYGAAGQSFGGIALVLSNGESLKLSFIKRLLEVIGAESWEKLKGKPVRVKASYESISAIGNYLEDEWFVLKDEIEVAK